MWLGGFYELAIELGPPSDNRLHDALRAIWKSMRIDGPFESRHVAPIDQRPVSPTLGVNEHYAHMYGVATLSDGQRLACGTVTVREGEEGSDWLVFYVPMGALALVYDTGTFPFGKDHTMAWRKSLDDDFARLAESVFDRVPFQLALVGHEVSGVVTDEEVRERGIPSKRTIGYLWYDGESLVWHPATNYG